LSRITSTHQHGAGSPLAAEAQALQGLEPEQLIEVLGEAAEECEERVPEDGYLEDADATETVGEGAGNPAAEGRYDEDDGCQYTRLGGGNASQTASSEGMTKLKIWTSSTSSDPPPKQASMVRRSVSVRSLTRPAWSSLVCCGQ
jgi:hypothetical protein